MITRTRTVTIDPAAQARHKREHYRRRIAKGDRVVNVWMTPETQEHLRRVLEQGACSTIEEAVSSGLSCYVAEMPKS